MIVRRAAGLSFVMVVGGLLMVVSSTAETACSSVPGEFCRGTVINRKLVPGTADPDPGCTACVEQGCCDLIGDCQGAPCAAEVGSAHACVLAAGRGAGFREPECVFQNLTQPGSKETYRCMHDRCGEACGLPVCTLDPVVPRIGSITCDHCFAQSCCTEMNECARNRTCLLTLECILTRCRSVLAARLTKEAHPAAAALAELACSPAGAQPVPEAGGDCFLECISENTSVQTQEAIDARCLAARVNECGADVACGVACAETGDAGADAG